VKFRHRISYLETTLPPRNQNLPFPLFQAHHSRSSDLVVSLALARSPRSVAVTRLLQW
jgi:hypothetical protein